MFYMQCLDDNGNGLLGTDNQTIFRDLKTLRGVLNRIGRYNLNHNKSYKVYNYTNFYDDNTFKLLKHVTLSN